MEMLLRFLGNGDDKDEKQVLLRNHPSTIRRFKRSIKAISRTLI